MEENIKYNLAMITLVIISVITGALIMNIYNKEQFKEQELNYILMTEDLLDKQGYTYKQLWIQKQQQLPIIEYTYSEVPNE